MIKLLLFSYLRETIGQEELAVEASNWTIAELKQHIEKTYDVALQQTMTAVNEQFATDATVLKDDDIVAFIPPISGG